ncbi:MAG: sigma-54 dependent transcriptional regulator [Planctomycetes bacterium]|nr:sigma-54 dependent transcriptional regulator [Planctomycetota bacterium]
MANRTHNRILIVDDEVELMHALCDSLKDQQFQVQGANSPIEALQFLREGEFDILLSDLMMPGMDGIQLLRHAIEIDPNLVGIIMTGQGTISTAVEAMKIGAFDYILKPFKLQAILPVLARAVDVRALKLENVRLREYVEELTFKHPRYRLVGNSRAMQKVMQMIEKVAPTDATVLVRGPSGAGKELVAHALHHNSLRKDRPMVTINCAALQETLLESELFGHEKGSFTGAAGAKRGLFEVAEGGTLFIDEIAEMSPSMQAKFLRVLENGDYRRVGGTQEIHADVRIIAATNKPLEEEQKGGRFREDLFYRLNVITVPLPSLKDRREDIPMLVEHFLTTRQLGKVRCQVAPEAMEAIVNYDWPGNIRELANVVERAQILAENNRITCDDLPDNLLVAPSKEIERISPGDSPVVLRDVERLHVTKVLQQMKGNKVHAARTLGISRRALYRLIAKYRLDEVLHEKEIKIGS